MHCVLIGRRILPCVGCVWTHSGTIDYIKWFNIKPNPLSIVISAAAAGSHWLWHCHFGNSGHGDAGSSGFLFIISELVAAAGVTDTYFIRSTERQRAAERRQHERQLAMGSFIALQ